MARQGGLNLGERVFAWASSWSAYHAMRTSSSDGGWDMACTKTSRGVAKSLVTGLVVGLIAAASILLSLSGASPARAQSTTAVLFQNVRIFDGKGDALSVPSNVLVRDNKIEKISTAAIAANGAETVTGGGRILMPGLIDAHWHAMLARSNPAEAITGDVGYLNLVAAAEAKATLMRGFTTIRDL